MAKLEFGSFADYLKLPARVYGAIAIVAGLLLFAPTQILAAIGLDKLAASYRDWIGIALLASVALLITELVYHLWTFYRAKAAALKASREQAQQATKAAEEKAAKEEEGRRLRLERLANLTRDEKLMLRRTCGQTFDLGRSQRIVGHCVA